MPSPEQSPEDVASQFSDQEMEQMKRYGAAQLGGTDFSEAVERELEKLQKTREANALKMRAAQTGQELGPSQFQEQEVKQTGALQQQATTQQASQASQAQSQQRPVNAPAAPGGPAGVVTPYPAQKAPGALPATGKTPSGGSEGAQAPPPAPEE